MGDKQASCRQYTGGRVRIYSLHAGNKRGDIRLHAGNTHVGNRLHAGNTHLGNKLHAGNTLGGEGINGFMQTIHMWETVFM